MDWDDLKPKPKKTIEIGEDLKTHSIAELTERVAALTAEIERVNAEMARKKAHNAAAEGLFKR
ncbi:MAG: DUF1192 domain-containing protein [Hyphomicrobiaceae bacterium]